MANQAEAHFEGIIKAIEPIDGAILVTLTPALDEAWVEQKVLCPNRFIIVDQIGQLAYISREVSGKFLNKSIFHYIETPQYTGEVQMPFGAWKYVIRHARLHQDNHLES
jgi:hypothetical protein